MIKTIHIQDPERRPEGPKIIYKVPVFLSSNIDIIIKAKDSVSIDMKELMDKVMQNKEIVLDNIKFDHIGIPDKIKDI